MSQQEIYQGGFVEGAPFSPPADLDMNLIPGIDPASMGLLFAALAAAQGEFQPIEKNRAVTITSRKEGGRSYSFRYADLQEIGAKTTPALSKNSLCLMQPVTDRQRGGTIIRTILGHSSGARVESILEVPRGDGDIKTFGAYITYLRRYVVSAMLGVAADDDLDEDGDDDTGGKAPGAAEIHPGMRDAKSIGELSKIMSGLEKADRIRFNDYYTQRTQELREAA